MAQEELYKSYYKRLFDGIPGYWRDIYARNSFYGLHYQRRRDVIASLIRQAGPAPGWKILDAGCGAGAYFPVYLEAGASVVGVDASDGMIEEAGRTYAEQIATGKVSVRTADIEALPYADGEFDLLVSAGVLMYLPEIEQALGEFHRVLRPGGFAVINVDNHRNFAAALDLPALLRGRWRRRMRSGMDGTAAPARRLGETAEPVTKSYAPGQLLGRTAAAGFSLVREAGHGFGPVRLMGRRVLPDALDRFLYRASEPVFRLPGLGRYGFTYSVLLRRE